MAITPDTIVALATPPGKSGVAVLRISGANAIKALHALGVNPPAPRYAHYCQLRHPESGELIDEALALYFQAPHSFTGEDVVEIQCHGSRSVIETVTTCLLSLEGIRHAEPGEFSRRALEQGKMDVLQIEALADLIEAETPKQQALALRQMGGEIHAQYNVLEQRIIDARAFCEVFLDFPDDDLPPDMDTQINEKIELCIQHVSSLLKNAPLGKQIREGVQVAIIGTPNVGKSTLINAIANKRVAITSDIAGTTRDVIEVYRDIHGMPFRFYDTAGLRDTDDTIERVGVDMAQQTARDADILLLLIDPTQPLEAQYTLLDAYHQRDIYLVVNKMDLVPSLYEWKEKHLKNVSRETFFISASKKQGIEELLEMLANNSHCAPLDTIYTTRQRHVNHLTDTVDSLKKALPEKDLVIKSEHLITAVQAIGKIIGKIDQERILDQLFSSFCIGK